MKRITFLIIVCGLFAATQAWAFSAGLGFFVLSNYELVKQADAIVLAKAVKANPETRLVQFKVVERLKGNCEEEQVSAYGYTEEFGWKAPKRGHFSFKGRSKKGDFSHARPGTYRGLGTATDYRIGQYYLLVLTNVKGEWYVGRPAQSRTQEEIDPNDSPWLVAVRHYIRISQLDDYKKEKAALRQLRAKAGTDPKKYPLGLVSDIDRHFSKPSPMKSYGDLMLLYRSAERQKEKVLYALAKAGHKEALPMVRKLIVDPKMCHIFVDYLARLKDRSSFETIADHFINSYGRNERWARALVDLADETHAETMLRVLEICREEKMARVVLPWFKDHPSPGVIPTLRKIVAGDYENQKKWYLTLQLASMGDDEVVRWAVEQLEKEGEKATRPIVVITRSPTQAANEMVRRLIGRADEKTLLHVFYGLITDGNRNPRRWDHLQAIVGLENKSDSFVRQIKDSLKVRKNEKAQSLLRMLEQ